MEHLVRPCGKCTFILGRAALVAAVGLSLAPPGADAQARVLSSIMVHPAPLLAHSGAAGYLGVDVTDIDPEKAQALKLKETHGALITLIDHDAPAGQIGLKVNDVVLAIDGQNVADAEQFRRILRQTPPGRTINLEICRDGGIQNLAVQLADHKAMEKSIWSKIGADVESIVPSRSGNADESGPAMGLVGSGTSSVPSSRFHVPFFGSTLNVGVLVEPLTSQMAGYLGVQGGLMVKQVAQKSEADTAGLKAFDVILKVGADPIATSADWARALRSNQGKPVQVTILRDRKQQILTLQVDSKRRSAVEPPAALFGPGPASA